MSWAGHDRRRPTAECPGKDHGYSSLIAALRPDRPPAAALALAMLLFLAPEAATAPRASRTSPISRASARTCWSATAWSSASTAPATRLDNSPFTQQSLIGMLERLGVNTRDTRHSTHANVAAVMVTATLPAFAPPGLAHRRARSARWATPRACSAARCWSRRCSAPTARSMPWRRARSPCRGFSAAGAGRVGHQGRADRGPHRRRRHRRARDRLPTSRGMTVGAPRRCAIPTSPPRSASPRRSTPSSAPIGQPDRPRHRSWSRCRADRQGDIVGAADRDRAAAGRAGPARARRHRRAVRRHRDGRERAHQHGRHRPGQPDHPHHRDAAGLAAEPVLDHRHDDGRAAAPTSRSTRRAAPPRRAVRPASASRSWSTASTPWASARAT